MGKVRDDTNGIEYVIRTSNEHFRAHIHVFYAEGAASIALDKVEVLARRKMPEKQLKEALEWVTRHRAELEQMYANQEQPGGIYKIQD